MVKMKLTELRKGDKALIVKLGGDNRLRTRLLELGMQKGAEIEVVKYAPLKDPLELILRGYHLSLRIKDADNIEVEIDEK
ncbi:MAG: ferrous iron transport protein A [Candidatus Marinimicrobia bacterium]|nr:ferrous iron transport protein A [Candidatus Neomarinimicrobiota bacterium]MBL7109580.1 ferrous iron transport protein A [Candidatus Neomarinimicrobiota bacterium]